MTDDEINRKVAEIEGWNPNLSDHPYACWWFRGNERHSGGPPPYVTGWVWCGPLIGKYNIAVSNHAYGNAALLSPGPEGWVAHSCPGDPALLIKAADTPQRAICLAVIAAQLSAIERGHRPK